MRVSIRSKLAAVSILASALACAAFVAFSWITYSQAGHASLRGKTEVLSSRLALTLAKAMWEYDSEGAKAIMRSELSDGEILALVLRDEKGELVSGLRSGEENLSGKSGCAEIGEAEIAGLPSRAYASRAEPIMHSAQVIGSVVVYVTDSPARGRLLSAMGGILLEALLAGLSIALAVFFSFERLVSRRLEALGDTVADFAGGDFSRRAAIARDDEIGELGRDFNQMAERLEELYGELRERDESLSSSLREKQILLREVNHRVKNNLQIIVSLLSMQTERMREGEERQLSEDSTNRIIAMAQVHELVYESDDFSRLDFSAYIRRMVDDFRASRRGSEAAAEIEVEAESIILSTEQAIPCGLIVNELLSNALRHAFTGDRGKAGKIILKFHEPMPGMLELRVEDNGKGLPEGFVPGDAESIGISLVLLLAKQLGGGVNFSGEGGTKVRLLFRRDRAPK